MVTQKILKKLLYTQKVFLFPLVGVKNFRGVVAENSSSYTDLEGKWLFCIMDAVGCIQDRWKIKYFEKSFQQCHDIPPFGGKKGIAKVITLKTQTNAPVSKIPHRTTHGLN